LVPSEELDVPLLQAPCEVAHVPLRCFAANPLRVGFREDSLDGLQQRFDLTERANPAPDGHRNVDAAPSLGDEISGQLQILHGGHDVEPHHLVGPAGRVVGGQLDRVAAVLEV